MHDTCDLPVQLAYPDAALTKRPPFRPRYDLGYGDPERTKKAYWRHADFDAAYQTHDGKHTYVSVLEVDVKAPTVTLPIMAKHTDKHLLYVLDGEATFRPLCSCRWKPLTLCSDQYSPFALAKHSIRLLDLPQGKHLLVGITVERGWLNRKGWISDMDAPPYPIDSLTRVLLTGMLCLATMPVLSMDHAIDGFAVQLVERHFGHAPKPEGDALTEAIKLGVRQQLAAGRYPSVEQLAEDIGYSRQTLHTHFKKQEGNTIMDFIIDAVMAKAIVLLRTDLVAPSAAAYRLGYRDQSAFNHQFKEYYGCSPLEAQLAEEAPTSRKPRCKQ